jgi:hypothetical protein
MENPENSSKNRLDVYSANGALVYSKKISEPEGVVDLNGIMTKGIYIFKFNLNESVITKSIVKE